MSDLGLNKYMAAAFSTGLLILGVNEASHAFFKHDKPEKPGYLVEVASADAGQGDDKPVWIPPTDYGVLLAEADIAKGEKKTAACVSCHKFEQGGANGTGPALYNIVMANKASVAGFSYSSALTDLGGQWDYEALDGFLKNPKKYASGTAMNYAGLSKEKDRMNVIAYLRTLSASPAALPAPLPPEAFIEPTDETATVVEEAAADAAQAVTEVATEATETVEEATNAVTEAVETVTAEVEVNDAAETVEAAEEAVAEISEEAANVVEDTVEDVTTEATDTVETAIGDITEEAAPAFSEGVSTDALEEAVTDAVEDVTEAAEEVVEDAQQ